jgi:hypothetical protein
MGTFFTSFAVVRVDYKLECGRNEWTTLGFAYKSQMSCEVCFCGPDCPFAALRRFRQQSKLLRTCAVHTAIGDPLQVVERKARGIILSRSELPL